MNNLDWEKLSFEQKKYNLRYWIFNQTKSNAISVHDGMVLDKMALAAIQAAERFLDEAYLTNFAHACGFIPNDN